MNTIIPVSNDRIASHFTKAERFIVINDQGQKTNTQVNPALNNHDCSAKKMIIELFKTEKVKRVIVRNIGQRILGKLLANDMLVFKSDVNYIDNAVVLDDTHSYLTALTSVEEGRPSLNHEKKGADCGCHDNASENNVDSHGSGKRQRCCDKQGHNPKRHGKSTGKGKCCH